MLAPPDLGLRRKLRVRRERVAQLAVVAVEIEAGAERGDHELRDVAKPTAECPPVARQRCVATRDRLEVLSGLTGYIKHVRGGCAQLKSPALVIVDVVT